MTSYLIAGIILVTLCMFGKNILLTIGHLFWAACAALAGAVVGALCGGDGRDATLHISLGAAIGVGCYAESVKMFGTRKSSEFVSVYIAAPS